MDHGKLTDHNGKKVDFRNVVLIMTTNAGAADLARPAIGFGSSKRTGDDTEAINRLFTPEFRNRLDAVIAFSGLPIEIILKVVEKFVFQLEAQLADRGVTIELAEDAAKWLAEKGYDERFGARPLARVIQEHIKKPLADELLFGKLEHGGTVRVLVTGEGDEKKLGFEYFPAEPKPKAKDGADEDDDDEEGDTERPALVEATPRKALSAPKDKKDRPKPGAVPSVPRRKEE
jgi:ATP-dependent Clp protease ATP-binding subunit ClpA